ncbi:MAG: hypothetical protein ABL874_08855 [Sphingopyxis sp.]
MAKAPAAGKSTPTKPAKAARTTAAKPAARATKPKAAPKVAARPAPKTSRTAIRDSVAGTADTIRSEATRKAGEIGDEVGRLYNQATEKALDAARQGKTRAAEGLESLARVIDDSAGAVDDKLGKQYGDFARSAAQTVANLAGTLDEKDLEDLVASTRDFVRKSPAVAIGSAAVVGFMLARLLRGNKDA